VLKDIIELCLRHNNAIVAKPVPYVILVDETLCNLCLYVVKQVRGGIGRILSLKHIENIGTVAGHIEKVISCAPKDIIELCLRHNDAIVADSFSM
jgi:hypothetical protein